MMPKELAEFCVNPVVTPALHVQHFSYAKYASSVPVTSIIVMIMTKEQKGQ